MVQLFVKKDEDREDQSQGQQKPAEMNQSAEKTESREEMEKQKAEELVTEVVSAGGGAWVQDAEKKLRDAQTSYDTEKLRQDLLGEISRMNMDQIERLSELLNKS